MSPWMCYCASKLLSLGRATRQFKEPSLEGRGVALEIPKDISRELSRNDMYLLTHLDSFQTQKLKGLERFISRFYGSESRKEAGETCSPSYIHKFLTPTVLAGFFADSGSIVGKNDDLVFEVSQWKDDLDSVHRMVGAFQKAWTGGHWYLVHWRLQPKTRKATLKHVTSW